MKILPFSTAYIDTIARLLATNQLVILPTDTIYGIHLPYKRGNQAGINDCKGRPANQPINLIYSRVSQITALFNNLSPTVIESASSIRGLSLIIDDGTRAGQAVRKIDSNDMPLLKRLLDRTGPLFSSSANVSGETYCGEPHLIARTFPTVPVFAAPDVSRETIASVLPSTIIDTRQTPWQIVRPGAVPAAAISQFMSN